MLNPILAVVLLAVAPFQAQKAQDEKAPDIDPKQVEEAVEGLETAFKKGKTEDRLAALSKYGGVNDGKVIKQISRGLKDKEYSVRSAAIESLRWLKHPDALDALHHSFKKDRAIKKDDALYQEMVKAIGQHGNPKSIDLLLDGALAAVPRPVQVARIYSLGNIRDKASIEGLMKIMQRTGRAGKRGGGRQPMMGEIRNSLRMLTGEDLGADEKAWADWWKANEKKFEVTAEPIGIPRGVQKKWDRYWGLDKKKEKSDEPKEKLGRGKDKTAARVESRETPVAAESQEKAPAQKKAEKPEQSWKAEIGKPAPDFVLKGVDGKAFKLANHRGSYVVLEWFNPGCPVVKAAHGEGGALRELGNDATERGAIWVAINSGSPRSPGSDREANLAAQQELGIDYPILLDPSGWVGRAYGAVTTPHMFVIDKRGILVYAGAHDDRNSNSPGGAKGVNFVERALMEAASGGEVSTPSTRAYGCGVKYTDRAKVNLVAPNFTLPDLTGEEFRLSDHRGKYVVLEWFNPGCPVVKKAHGEDGTLEKCAKRMTRGGVVWVAVNSGGPGKQGASLSANAEAVKRWNMNHPVLLDPDGKVGKTFGAKVTPQIFVIDKRGVVVYAGAAQARDGGPNLIEQALTELSCGKPVSVKKSEPYGCGVKYAD